MIAMVAEPSPAMEKERTNLVMWYGERLALTLHLLYISSYSVVLPVIRVGEEDVVEPNGWIDQWYLDPALSLLPVQPPEINTFSLSRTKDYVKPVGHKL